MAIYGTTEIISDVGANANSYISIDFAKSQWSMDKNKDFSSFTDEAIAKLCIMATSVIDLEYWALFDGELFNSDYALMFPRTGLTDMRGVQITDYTVYPVELMLATAELAYYLNANDGYLSVTLSGVKSQSLDGVGSKEFYDLADLRSATKIDVIPTKARKLLEPLLIGGQSYGDYTASFVRG